LREQLKTIQFWSLEICVILALALFAIVAREGGRRLARRDWAYMGGLTLLALALTVFLPPRTNRIYYDEQIYQSIGQNLADLKLAQMCNDGTVEYGRLQCWSGEYNKQPYAYPHLLSLAYRAFGVGPDTAFAVNAFVMAATVVAAYLLVLTLFNDRMAALFAGLLLTLIPQQLVWSATAAVEPSASLACLAAIAGAAQFTRSRSTAALAFATVSAAYAIQFRPESVLVLPVIGLLLWRYTRDELGRARVWWMGLLFIGLVAAHIGHMFVVRNEGWGTTGPRLSLAYVATNLRVNGPFYVGDERFPVVFTLLALAGLFARPCRTARLALLAHFGVFFAIGLLFYAGSYNYGADVRYSLMTYPPIAVLGGLGTARAVRWVRGAYPRVPAVWGALAAIAFQFLWYAPIVRATTEEAWAARADVRFARSFVAELPPNSYVLTHNPGMFHVWGINAGQMSVVVTNPSYLIYLTDRYAGGVYMHWNFWCNVQDPVQREFCRRVLENTPAEMVREHRERDQRYAMYRLTKPDSLDVVRTK
jgi:4-amino-4-deoxy-L-arabinose transferase-like glycosyltransferase